MSKLYVISGAGLSVDSGIRAFRTDTVSGKSLWDEYDLEEVCNIQAFNGNFYHKTHAFYNKRREELATVEPNIAHLRIAEWYKKYPNRVVNLTTNVDDLLERAGVPQENILHIHGYLPEIRYKLEEDSEEKLANIGNGSVDVDAFHWVKPNVIFFGEMAPAYTELYHRIDDINTGDVVILVGCSNTVIDFNWDLLRKADIGAKVHIVNPQVKYHEQELYNSSGITVWRAGAAETFQNKHFISTIEGQLDK